MINIAREKLFTTSRRFKTLIPKSQPNPENMHTTLYRLKSLYLRIMCECVCTFYTFLHAIIIKESLNIMIAEKYILEDLDWGKEREKCCLLIISKILKEKRSRKVLNFVPVSTEISNVISLYVSFINVLNVWVSCQNVSFLL